MLICYLILLNLFNILILMPILLYLFPIFASGNSSTKPIIFLIMCYRFHFKRVKDAECVKSLLIMRGHHVTITKSHCMFNIGVVLEIDDTCFELASQVIDAFEMFVIIES